MPTTPFINSIRKRRSFSDVNSPDLFSLVFVFPWCFSCWDFPWSLVFFLSVFCSFLKDFEFGRFEKSLMVSRFFFGFLFQMNQGQFEEGQGAGVRCELADQAQESFGPLRPEVSRRVSDRVSPEMEGSRRSVPRS